MTEEEMDNNDESYSELLDNVQESISGSPNNLSTPGTPFRKKLERSPNNYYQRVLVLIIFIIFQITPLLLYLFGWILFNSLVCCVFVFLSSIINFWFTKNYAGSFLAGLKWGCTKENGSKEWYFENYKIKNRNSHINPINRKNANLFKIFIYTSSIIWPVFAIFALIRFNIYWFISTGFTAVLCFLNAWGFHRCNVTANEKLKAQFLITGVIPTPLKYDISCSDS